MRTIRLRHWAVALGIALAAHAAVFTAWQVSPPDGTQAFGGTAIHIALAPEAGTPKPESGARPGSAHKPEPPSETQPTSNSKSSEPESKPEPKPEPKPKPDPEQKSESKPAPETEPGSKAKPKPEQQSEPEPKLEPEPEPKPQSKPEPEPKPKPKPKPKPEPQPEPESESEPTPQLSFKPKPAPDPNPVRNPAPEPMVSKKPEQPSTRNRNRSSAGQQASASAIAGAANVQESRAQGRQKSDKRKMPLTVGAGAMPPSYLDELRARLARNKTYPRRARRLDLEGRAVFYLVINRDGELVKWTFRQRTGHDILDRAVERMIKSATPLPPFPSDMSGQRLELTIPVTYQLK